MKPAQPFAMYIEFATRASEGVADLSVDLIDLSELVSFGDGGYSPEGIPLVAEERSPFDWLAIFLFQIFNLYYRADSMTLYKRVLNELETVKTEEQIGQLLAIEEKYASLELVGYDDQWAKLEFIKNALREEIGK